LKGKFVADEGSVASAPTGVHTALTAAVVLAEDLCSESWGVLFAAVGDTQAGMFEDLGDNGIDERHGSF
jgi:hypothetical protein